MYMKEGQNLWIGTSNQPVYLRLDMANRHGLIAGATGTGKTVSLKVMAESFSEAGVPVFLVDIKGDVSGLAVAGEPSDNVSKRVEMMNIPDWSFTSYPVRFWDIFGQQGTPIRTTVSDMGADLLARILKLNDTQTGVLKLIFKIADDESLLLLDMKDLRAMVQYVGDHASEYKTNYGNISTQTIGAIQRAVLNMEEAGGEIFFGEPEFDVQDWLAIDSGGKGIINLLHAVELIKQPLLYSTFLLWLLSEIYEILPEVGDLDKPKFVFFFDEAHLLFKDSPNVLLEKIEQVVRLIRSKGVGVYFVTQQPADIPDSILAQLGHKVQHALRSYTPKEQKAVKAAAASFRENELFDTEQVLGELGTGEALLSMLDEDGVPTIVERGFILPIRSSFDVAPQELVQAMIRGNGLDGKYRQSVDNLSAFEALDEKQRQEEEQLRKIAEEEEKQKQQEQAEKERLKQEAIKKKEQEKKEREKNKGKERLNRNIDRVVTNTLSSIGRTIGTSIVRGLFGTRKK